MQKEFIFNKTIKIFALSFLSFFLMTNESRAAGTLTFTESGGNVIATFNGSVNTAGLTPDVGNPVGVSNTLYPAISFLTIGTIVPGTLVNKYYGATFSAPFGTGGNFTNSSASGDIMGFWGQTGAIYLPIGYQSGNSLVGTTTFTGQTIASLNLTVGTSNISWGAGANADSITVNIGSSPAPAPASVPTLSEWSLIALAFMVSSLLFLNKRRENI